MAPALQTRPGESRAPCGTSRLGVGAGGSGGSLKPGCPHPEAPTAPGNPAQLSPACRRPPSLPVPHSADQRALPLPVGQRPLCPPPRSVSAAPATMSRTLRGGDQMGSSGRDRLKVGGPGRGQQDASAPSRPRGRRRQGRGGWAEPRAGRETAAFWWVPCVQRAHGTRGHRAAGLQG